MNRALRRWLPVLAAGALLVAAWVAAALSAPQLNNLPVPRLNADGAAAPPTAQPEETPEESPSPSPETVVDVPDDSGDLLGIAVLGLLVVVGGVVTWVFVRNRIMAARKDPLIVQRPAARRRAEPDELVAAVDAGISELSDTDADPRRAVIACWLRLEQAAAAAGTPRHVGDSPTDLVTRLLHGHRVSAAVLEDLSAVYREARYASHPVDERMRATAVAALRQVRSELQPGPVRRRVASSQAR